MSWPIEHFHSIPASSSFIEMMPGAMKAMTQCAAVKPGENVVIACDTNKMRMAEALAAAAYAVGGIPTIVTFPPTGAHGAQVPKSVVGAAARSDVLFMPTSWSMTHTDARIEAIKNGSRVCTMCEVTEDCLCAGGIQGDFEENDRVGRKIGAIMAAGKTIRMTSPAGTDLSAEITGRPVQTETERARSLAEQTAQAEGVSVEEVMAQSTKSIPIGRMIKTAEIAALEAFLLSDLAASITGAEILIDGGFTPGI